MVSTSFTLRPARRGEQRQLRQMVSGAGLNPFGLSWRRFIVADKGGEIIGCVQRKQHRDGSVELASLLVQPTWRGRGVARALVERLQTDAGPPLWLMCRGSMEPFYTQFGFVAVDNRVVMPPYFKRIHWVYCLLLPLLRSAEPLRIMHWSEEAFARAGS